MIDKDYKELISVLQQMINDKVQLVYGGQIVNWEDTKIPELLQKIKNNNHATQNTLIGNSDN